ncbi:MAG: hypothetical protein JNM56_09235 [Planctomycetia bacterium]|nr:hypothetical protein [Planctomycetia bacterium]
MHLSALSDHPSESNQIWTGCSFKGSNGIQTGDRPKAGGQVVVVTCIVDRLEGARERLANYDFRPMFTIRDFGIEPPQ